MFFTLKKSYLVTILSILILTTLVACGDTDNSESTETDETPVETETVPEASEEDEDDSETVDGYFPEVSENPVVTIVMETDEEITIELFPNYAPNTVANFISLINQEFYDGLIFHRVIDGFMIQGGDPLGTGLGGPDYAIAGEFTTNGFENPINHERGIISMARSQSRDSAGSQFFIVHQDAEHLDGQYASFGEVIEGMDVVDRIATVDKNQTDKPLDDEVMRTVTVETFGVDYPDPIKE